MRISYEQAKDIIFALYESERLNQNKDSLTVAVSLIGEILHRTRPIHSGLISVKANEERKKNSKYVPTKDHYFGRAQSGRKIFKAVERGKSEKFITALIMSRSRVHYVTSKENNTLKKYSHLNNRDAYSEVKIALIPFEKRNNQKYVYIIDGVVYNETKSILEMYGIKHNTLLQRCKSKKKWPTWKKI
jgi:virulence-associated protein VapD